MTPLERLLLEAIPDGTFGGARPHRPRPQGTRTTPTRRCQRCGRTGTRCYREIPATEHTQPTTVCTNTDACQRRTPVPAQPQTATTRSAA